MKKKFLVFILSMLVVTSVFAETEKRVDGKRVETYKRITATDMTVTNPIAGSVTGNAGTVTNGVYTTGAGTVYLAPDGSAADLTSFPTLNQNTTGTAKNLTTGQHLKFTIVDPATTYTKSATICIWNKTDAAIHIKNIEFRCNADPTTEPTGDIKYADDLIGLGTPTVIAAFDTTAGTFSSGAINVAVAAGKCIYLSYDAAPDPATTQHAVDINWLYD